MPLSPAARRELLALSPEEFAELVFEVEPEGWLRSYGERRWEREGRDLQALAELAPSHARLHGAALAEWSEEGAEIHRAECENKAQGRGLGVARRWPPD